MKKIKTQFSDEQLFEKKQVYIKLSGIKLSFDLSDIYIISLKANMPKGKKKLVIQIKPQYQMREDVSALSKKVEKKKQLRIKGGPGKGWLHPRDLYDQCSKKAAADTLELIKEGDEPLVATRKVYGDRIADRVENLLDNIVIRPEMARELNELFK
tara:strand:- start:197 stop:661 length:465 start_codon:yes stop_codon:yes gene_type:complete